MPDWQSRVLTSLPALGSSRPRVRCEPWVQRRVRQGSAIILVQEGHAELEADIRTAGFAPGPENDRRQSLRIMGGRLEGELGIFLKQNGWYEEMELAETSAKARVGPFTPPGPPVVRPAPSSPRQEKIDSPDGTEALRRPPHTSPYPTQPVLSASHVATEARPRGFATEGALPARRRAALVQSKPRSAAESARMVDESMSDNPRARAIRRRQQVREWRRDSFRMAQAAVIDHEVFAASLELQRPRDRDVGSGAEDIKDSRNALGEASRCAAGTVFAASFGGGHPTPRKFADDSPRGRARALILERWSANTAMTRGKWPELVCRAWSEPAPVSADASAAIAGRSGSLALHTVHTDALSTVAGALRWLRRA